MSTENKMLAVRCVAVWLACFVAAEAAAIADTDRIAKVENGIESLVVDDAQHPVRLDIFQLMRAYNDPGLSIAVIDDYRIAWKRGYGTIGADKSARVNDRTLFQAGSISKPVAATAMLRLVEGGKLSLDEDVNAYLKTWKVPDNEFTEKTKVTLRRLASHTAGTTVHGFPGYDVDAPRPTISQVLDGAPPANTARVIVNILPGSKTRYSGGGVTIEQLVLTDVTGEPFPALLRKSVFERIDMHDSTFEQPLPGNLAARAAHGTYQDGKPVHGNWHVYPEMAAAGLWTTPGDLAKFAIETALAEEGKSSKLLSQSMTRERLSAQPGGDGHTALGFFVSPESPGEFSHDGADEGFQASLVMNAKTGKGVVIMTNSDNGMLVAWDLIGSVATQYEWTRPPEKRSLARRLSLITQIKGADAALKAFALAKADPGQAKQIDSSVLDMVGTIAWSSGRREDGLKVFERNAREYPDSAESLAGLGEAYAELHRKESARVAFNAALKVDPANRAAAEGLKKLDTVREK